MNGTVASFDGSVFSKTVMESLGDLEFHFKDYAEGKDLLSWKGQLMEIVGLLIGHAEQNPAFNLSKDDAVDLLIPCFFDSDPGKDRQYAGDGTKVKFNGKPAQGLLMFMGGDVITLWVNGHLYGGGAGISDCVVHRSIISSIVEFHEMKFKLSMLSASAGSTGYEIIFPDYRALFRFALAENDKERTKHIFTKRLDATYIPLFKEMHVQKWVVAGGESDPKDELGDFRHYPYGV